MKRNILEKEFNCKLDTNWAIKKILTDKGYFNPEDLELLERTEVIISGKELKYENGKLSFKPEVLNDYRFYEWLDIPKSLHDYIDYEINESQLNITVWEFDYAENLGQTELTDEQETDLSDEVYTAETKFEEYYKEVQERFKTDLKYYLSEEYIQDVIDDLK